MSPVFAGEKFGGRHRVRVWGAVISSMIVASGAVVIGVSSAGANQPTGTAVSATLTPHAIDAFIIFSRSASGINGAGGTGGPGNIEVVSWSWGVQQNIGSQSSGAGAGKVTLNPFSITRKIDRASPLFFQVMMSKKLLPKVTLFMTPSANVGSSAGDSAALVLTNAHVKSITWTGSGGSGESPKETIEFNYQSG